MKIVPGPYRMRNGRKAIVHWNSGEQDRPCHGSYLTYENRWAVRVWDDDGTSSDLNGNDDLIAPWTEPRKFLAWRCKKPIYEECALNTPRNYRAYQGTVEWWDTLITGDDEFWERIEQLDVEIK